MGGDEISYGKPFHNRGSPSKKWPPTLHQSVGTYNEGSPKITIVWIQPVLPLCIVPVPSQFYCLIIVSRFDAQQWLFPLSAAEQLAEFHTSDLQSQNKAT